jgi:hypothetical protein
MANERIRQKDDNEGLLRGYRRGHPPFDEKPGQNGDDTPRVWPGFSTAC